MSVRRARSARRTSSGGRPRRRPGSAAFSPHSKGEPQTPEVEEEQSFRSVTIDPGKGVPPVAEAGEDQAFDTALLLPLIAREAPLARMRMASPSRKEVFRATFAHAFHYVARHIRRSAAKSLLSFGVALLLAGLTGQFTLIRGLYADAYENIDAKAYYLDGIMLDAAKEVNDSLYVAASYFENRLLMECKGQAVSVAITNDIERFGTGRIRATFLNGYDFSSFSALFPPPEKVKHICILDGKLAESIGVKPGDSVRFDYPGDIDRLLFMKFGSYTSPDKDLSFEEQMHIVEEELNEAITRFLVVGVINSGAPDTVFLPVTTSLYELLERRDLLFDYVEFTLKQQVDIEVFRAFGESKSVAPFNSIAGSSFVIDTSEASNMERLITLLGILYLLHRSNKARYARAAASERVKTNGSNAKGAAVTC